MKPIIRDSYLTKIPHEGGELSFQYPAFKGTYADVSEQIDKAGAKRPNSAETASLVYDAWKTPKEKYSSEIISILKRERFWEYTGHLYLPKSHPGDEIKNGVILESNPKIENEDLVMDKNSLVERLQKDDPLVKFVPFGFKIGEQTCKELEKNDYIIARYGKEGAEKIAEIASNHNRNSHFTYLWSFNYVNKEKRKISAINFSERFGGMCLFGDGSYWSLDHDNGHAFGVCKE